MNDIILSSLLNLFALFGSLNRNNKENAKRLISNYLTKHFGVRNLDTYLSLYSDLRDFYDDSQDLDKESIVERICHNIISKVTAEEQALLLLRFMEFSSYETGGDGFDKNKALFQRVADLFNIPGSVFDEFCAYVTGETNDNVAVFNHDNIDGSIKALNIKKFNIIVFTYTGKDEVMMNDIPILPDVFMIWEHSGVLKSHKSTPLYYSNIVSRFENDKNIEVVELAGRNINFRFPNSDVGIHNLTFTLNSGQLVAIMGGSGVGKSTLLSLLNGSIRPQEGAITLNGHEINDLEVKQHIGFVPQDDLLIEELTVYQNLWYTAKLCFDKVSDEQLNEKVIGTLSDLGLLAAKDLTVGSAINKYISGGQRKRLNIALELIREPSVLFLDEPTSGLSSSDSEMVMNLLKEQTYKGKLIVVNIHQPSSEIFKLFDKLWLLDKGGYPVYDGNPIEAVSYFKGVADYADAQVSECPACGNVNPEIMLNIIDAKSLDDSGRVTDHRKISPEEWHQRYLETKTDVPPVEQTDVPKTIQCKPSAFKQLQIFLQRNVKAKLTNLQYILLTLLEAPLLAVIVAFLTRFAPEEGYSVMYNENIVSYFFMAIIVAIFLGMSGSAEEIIKDRALLKRESFLNLSHSSYIWSKILYMAAVSLVQTGLFVLVGNSIMCIKDLFLVWWMILFVSSFLAGLTGLVLSQSLNSVVAIYITIPLLLIPQILLCGLVVDFEDLNPRSKTGNVPIIGEVIPSRWAFEALAVSSFTMNEYEKPLFAAEKQKFSDFYYRTAFLYELESQLETIEDETKRKGEAKPFRMELIKNELPRLASYCDMEDYSGGYDYPSLNDYFLRAEKVLDERGRNNGRLCDRIVDNNFNKYGKDGYYELKKAHYNLFLEDLVYNADAEKVYKVVGNSIVPTAGQIFLDPVSKNGRAPFYSSNKIFCGYKIPTLWFNIGILVIMCIFVCLALFLRFPSRLMANKRDK